MGYGKITLISIKSKELVQTIEYFYKEFDISYSNYMNIYIDSKSIFIIPFNTTIYEYKYNNFSKDFEEIAINRKRIGFHGLLNIFETKHAILEVISSHSKEANKNKSNKT